MRFPQLGFGFTRLPTLVTKGVFRFEYQVSRCLAIFVPFAFVVFASSVVYGEQGDDGA